MRTLTTITILFLAIMTLKSQSEVSISANRYRLNIYNKADHFVKVSYGKNKKKVLLFPGGDSYNLTGNFSRRKLKRKDIRVFYDEVTRQKDKRIITNAYTNRMSRIENWYNQKQQLAQTEFEHKIIAELAANFRPDPNTGNRFLDGLINIASWGVRKAGEGTRFMYKLKDAVSEFDSLHFDSVWDAIAYFGKKKIASNYVQSAAEYLKDELGTNAESNKNVINAFVTLMKQGYTLDEVRKEEETKAANEKDRALRKIDALSNGLQSTIKAGDLLRGNEDFSTKTPKINISIDPLSYGNDLNKYWKSPSEAIMKDTNNDDELEWQNGLWNATLGGAFRIAVSPEMRLGKKSFSRLYAGASYYNTSYKLSSDGVSLTNNFFSQSPANSPGFTISKPLAFNYSRYGGDISWRFFPGRNFIFDLNGGYIRTKGVLNMTNSELSDGYEWAEEKISFIETADQPFFGAKIGYWKSAKYSGTKLSCGVQFYKQPMENNTIFRIVDTDVQTDVSVVNDGSYLYRINVGLDFTF